MNRVVLGDVNGHVLLASTQIGERGASTTSQEFGQPYANSYRTTLPSKIARDSFGFKEVQVSLTGRLNVPESTNTASIAVSTSSGGLIEGTIYESQEGATYSRFHTPRGTYPDSGDDGRFVDYHLKSDDGTEVSVSGPIQANLWGLIE